MDWPELYLGPIERLVLEHSETVVQRQVLRIAYIILGVRSISSTKKLFQVLTLTLINYFPEISCYRRVAQEQRYERKG